MNSQAALKAPWDAESCLPLCYPNGEGFEARNALFKVFIEIGEVVTFHGMSEVTQL